MPSFPSSKYSFATSTPSLCFFFFFFSFSLIPIYVQFCMLLNPFCDFICVLSCGDFCMIRGLSVCENCRQYSIQITVIFLSNFV